MHGKLVVSDVLLIAVFGAALFFVGCEGDTGPAGPAGEAGTTACLTCHTDDDSEILARSTQWEHSRHATGGTYERNTGSCAGCHTSEGFLARLATGSPVSPENPSPVGCFTCHSPHTEGDFSLRTEAPVTFEFGTGTFNYGPANLCANCHHGRVLDPPISASTSIDDTRWGPHHGPQSDMIAGKGAYEFAKSGAYSNSPHTALVTNGCVACHMAAPYGSQAGGHQFGVSYEYHGSEEHLVSGCNVAGCHSSAPLEDFNRTAAGDYDGDGDIEGVQDEVDGLMDALRAELLALGFIDADDYVVADEDDPLVLNADEAGALLNFRYNLEDQSHGIHNTDYVVGMLQASIAALKK